MLLYDQNSFGQSKMVLVWPNWFGLDHNDLVLTKMKWSWPKWIGQVQIVIFYQNESHLDLTNSFWSWPNHYGQVQFNFVRSKPFWTNQNCFGHIKGQDIHETELQGLYLYAIWVISECTGAKTARKTWQLLHTDKVRTFWEAHIIWKKIFPMVLMFTE